MNYVFEACGNRGSAPAEFVEHLVSWGMIANPSLFDLNECAGDIFDRIYPYLGPWPVSGLGDFILFRKCCMLELLRVLALRESSCRWNEGRDVTNPRENDAETISAGCWQVSYDSRNFGDDLRKMCREAGIWNGEHFQAAMKERKMWATTYTVRLLRHTFRHHGPLIRVEGDSVYPWLRRQSVAEFAVMLATR